MKVVLFVDDEKLITRALSQIFDDNQHLYIFKNSADEALEYMETHPVDLLCTDIVMPEVDGFALLEQVQTLYPKVTRIALSSFNNNSQIKKLINENLAQFYLLKPWDEMDLKRSIFKILNTQTALYSKELLQMVHSIKSLPTIPNMYKELIRLIKMDSPMDEISKVVSDDLSTVSAVLKIANSAYYGRRTGDISKAIINIGLNNLKSIVLSESVFESLSHDLESLNHMWKQAALSNKIMTAIYAECLKKPIPNLFASAALLHDIGRLVFLTHHASYQTLVDQSKEEGVSLSELEKERYGVCHEDIGGYLLNSWDLPFAYVEAAMFHHRPLDYRIINRELVSVVHISHYYAEMMDGNDLGQMDDNAFRVLAISKETIETLIETLQRKR